jgi:hypothetical protein
MPSGGGVPTYGAITSDVVEPWLAFAACTLRGGEHRAFTFAIISANKGVMGLTGAPRNFMASSGGAGDFVVAVGGSIIGVILTLLGTVVSRKPRVMLNTWI